MLILPRNWVHRDGPTDKESDFEKFLDPPVGSARGTAERGGDRRLRKQQQQQLDHDLIECRVAVDHVVDNVDQLAAANAAVAALVPAALKSKGTLTVAADATYAPNEFIASDGHTVIGMDADLMKALAAVMGLKVNVVNATFDSIIPGLAAGKYDVGASSFTDTKEREKTVDFVDYFTAGESFFTKASGGATINSDRRPLRPHGRRREGHDRAGRRRTRRARSARPPASRRSPCSRSPTRTAPTWRCRAAARSSASPTRRSAEYQVKKSNGQFKLVGQSYANAPYGLAVPKNGGLAKPVLAALKVLMKNGSTRRS